MKGNIRQLCLRGRNDISCSLSHILKLFVTKIVKFTKHNYVVINGKCTGGN